tara:strand:- start:77 stop:316 length:240 start_codon:yes stop_codon:yes gene_type:complete
MTSSINRKRTEQIKEKKLNLKVEELKQQNSEILLNEVNVMPVQDVVVAEPEVKKPAKTPKKKVVAKKKTAAKKKVTAKK